MAIPNAFDSPLATRSAVGAALAAVIAGRAVRRRSLDASGGVAGFVVMAVHIACGYRYGALLLAFFFSSSKVTKIGEDHKRRIEENFKEGGQRNWIQVLANSTIATVLVVIFALMTGGQDQCMDSNGSKLITGIIGGIIGHYCCCNGDTWSSEIGVLSNEQPRLITSLKTPKSWACYPSSHIQIVYGIELTYKNKNRVITLRKLIRSITSTSDFTPLHSKLFICELITVLLYKPVRKGTNGGVTLQGLLAATGGGLIIGLTFVVVGLLTAECSSDMAIRQLLVLPISAAAGLLGSLIDSLLGATLEFSGYCSVRKKVVSKRGPTVTKISGMTILDNDAVNAVSILLTTVLTAYVCIYIF
ncbi:Protein PGR [Zea mays]|uniref:Protein PGR n=1 Tax=Zea mays TaxID=4577 RepID=A0A3L6FZT4_MAIZE|nr:Protein PGR [Zea mays]